MTQAGRGYHHGNLRDAMIVAAANLIEEHGSLDFTMTDAARSAGVSNAAPYRHFRDKEDLLHEVRGLAFMGLHEAVLAKLTRFKHAGSIDAIIGIGETYLEYARFKRAFFSLMWEDRGDIERVREEVEHKMSGFNVLLNAVDQYCARLGADQEHEHSAPVNIATQLWALAHGIATLEANHMLNLFDRAASPEKLLSESTRALLAGLHPGSQLPEGNTLGGGSQVLLPLE